MQKILTVCTFSRRMIVARYAENIYLLQPVVEINRIEKHRSLKRDAQTKSDNNPFAYVFQKAKERHSQATKQGTNGFDMMC